MYKVNKDMSIYITRGDAATLYISAEDEDGKAHTFRAGDVLRFSVMEKKKCDRVLFSKDVTVTEQTESVPFPFGGDETKLGEIISKPKDYWYEIELNPGKDVQTIIGYDEDGAKLFRLFPESANE